MTRKQADRLAYALMLVVVLGMLVFTAFLWSVPASSTPHHAPLVVKYEICANSNAPATRVAVQEYALCVNAVNQAWHDERTWK